MFVGFEVILSGQKCNLIARNDGWYELYHKENCCAYCGSNLHNTLDCDKGALIVPTIPTGAKLIGAFAFESKAGDPLCLSKLSRI